MTSRGKLLSSFLCLSLASLAACSDGGFATQPGDSVITDEIKTFSVASSGGGLVYPAVPQGAACDPQVWTYTVHIDQALFAWDRCTVDGDATDPAAYARSSGTRPLDAGTLDSVLTTARAVHVSGRMLCGADKPVLRMTVTSPSGSFTYGDDFYSCRTDMHNFVESQQLDNLASVLHELYTGPLR